MSAADTGLAAIERAAARELGRGSATLAAHTQGELGWAARSLLSAAGKLDVVVLTGFFIPTAASPAAETDGPVGAAQLAAAVLALGGRVRLLTDAPCQPVVAAALHAAGPAVAVGVPIELAPLPGRVGWPAYHAWEVGLLSRYASVTHLVSIERVGPGLDGASRNMRGVDIGAHTAPLERVFAAGAWTRVAVGDGGNEIGMGRLPRQLVAASVPLGEVIHCVVGCDALIVSGTSNWGAAALVAGLALLAPARRDALLALLEPQWSLRVLTDMVERGGAVDGVSGQPTIGVDGLAWPDYASTLAEIDSAVREYTPRR